MSRSLSIAVLVCLCGAAPAHAWRSQLYPLNWQPGDADLQGRFLHDFSFAGYQMGDRPIPVTPPGPVLDVTAAPYGADPTGAEDSTAAIQSAIDAAGAAGGGVVYLPAGTYRVKPPPGAVSALYIGRSGVVLRGAGSAQTFVFNDEPVMRDKRIINVRPDPANHFAWYWGDSDVRPLVASVTEPTTRLFVDTTGYQVGDWIVVRADATPEFIAEHGMTGVWLDVGGPIFYRRIVDVAGGELTIDVPTRYPLSTRDNARIHRIAPHLEEIGIEYLSIGNRQSSRAGTGNHDYAVEGTGAYEMHNSFAIYFTHVVNSWVRDVATYRPAVNTADVHLLSNGLRLDASRFVTVTDCHFQRAQYQGAGGNGYLFVMTGSENLITGSRGERGRHNFSFGLMYVSGNVIHRSTSRDGKLPVDFHMHLSMANLIDNVSLDNDSIEALERTCCNHGHSTTESVIWNTEGIRYPTDQLLQQFIVDSAQFGNGYVIGTRGLAYRIRLGTGTSTAPVDWSEGIGEGATLEPASLYEDQLARRVGVAPPGEDPDGTPGGTDAGIGSDDPPAGGCAATRPGTAWLVVLVSIIAFGVAPRRRRARD